MEEVSRAKKLLLAHGGASTFLGPVSEALVLLQPQYYPICHSLDKAQ